MDTQKLLNKFNNREPLSALESIVIISKSREAAAELASLRERAEKAEAERDVVKELAKRARVQLQATQINWQEECLYECNDLLTIAIGACPSCTWRGDVTLQDGKCPYCKTDWLKLEVA